MKYIFYAKTYITNIHIYTHMHIHIHTYTGWDKSTFTVVHMENNRIIITLAGVAQWIERWPANQSVAGSIPSQGTCLGCRSGPQ